MTNSIKNLKSIYIVGDYAKGIDSGNIKIYIKGKIDNLEYINLVIKKTEKINRNIQIVDEIDPFDETLKNIFKIKMNKNSKIFVAGHKGMVGSGYFKRIKIKRL